MRENISNELENSLEEFGQRIRIARIRRELSAEQVARRASICRSTVIKIEKGCAGVAIGYYVRVLAVLGLEGNLIGVALNDPVGRAMFEARFERRGVVSSERRANKCAQIKQQMYKLNH